MPIIRKASSHSPANDTDGTAAKPIPAPAPEKEAKAQQPTRKLPTDRIAFSKQLDILRAYALASSGGTKPVHYSGAAEVVKMSATTVSLMNTFMIDNGFVEKSGNDFLPHRALLDFAQAYSWNPETAARKLAPLIRGTWFGERMLMRLRFSGMNVEDMIADLAGQIAAPPDCKSQLETLIDYAAVSGVVKRDGLQLSVGDQASPGSSVPEPQRTESAPMPEQELSRSDLAPRSAGTVATGFMSAAGRVRFHVDIDVDMAEMAGWTPERISAFFAGLAQVLAAKKGTEDV